MPRHQIGIKTRKIERLEARVTREQKRIIARAAQLRGTSVTDFLVVSAQQAACYASGLLVPGGGTRSTTVHDVLGSVWVGSVPAIG